jgi:hypothetical protein
MKNAKIGVVVLLIAITLAACSSKKPAESTNQGGSTVASAAPQIDPQVLRDTSKWKKVSSDSRFFKFNLMVPEGAKYQFSPDTVMGTENGVFIAEDRFPNGLTIEYNALNDRDARTVTFKTDYLKGKPSDIDFGLPNAIVAEGTNTRGLAYTRYLVRKEDNLYILSIQTKNPAYTEVYKNIIKSFKIEK